MFTVAFWKAAAERATKSAAQAAALVIGQDALDVNLFDADWRNVAGVAAAAAVLSFLTSIGSASVGVKGSPSLAPEAEVAAATHDVA